MSFLDQLQQMIGIGGDQQPQAAAAPAGGQYSPEIQAILQQAGYAPEDPGAARRRAIAQGLASFGKNLASSKQDFLPALGEAMPTGAETYLKAREGQEDDRRKASIDLLKQVFGFDKAETGFDLRRDRNGVLERQGDRRLGQGDQNIIIKLDRNGVLERQGDERIGETGRSNLVKEDQGQQKINETKDYHGVLNQNADDKTAIMQKRLEDTYGTDQERLRQGRIRLQQQDDAGKRDAARLKAQMEGGYYKKGDRSTKGISTAKSRIDELTIRAKILGALKEKAHLMGLDDTTMEYRDPDAYKAGKLEMETYSKALFNEFGYDERGLPLPDTEQATPTSTDTAQPIPQPNEVTQPQQPAPVSPGAVQPPAQTGGQSSGMGSRSDPVTGITSQAQFDAVPSGAWYINPADGKRYRKK